MSIILAILLLFILVAGVAGCNINDMCENLLWILLVFGLCIAVYYLTCLFVFGMMWIEDVIMSMDTMSSYREM
jgi:hypothetical protein